MKLISDLACQDVAKCKYQLQREIENVRLCFWRKDVHKRRLFTTESYENCKKHEEIYKLYEEVNMFLQTVSFSAKILKFC